MAETSELTSKTVEEFSEWLGENSVPLEYCKKDGSEFTELSDAEIKEMVLPIGLARKIIKLLPKVPSESMSVTPSSSRPVFVSPPSSPPYSPPARSEGSTLTISSTPSRSEKINVPEFWRDDMQHCIDEGILDDDSRSDITRTLVTLLVSKYGPKPGRVQCEELGRQLILKYPFMKDDLGNGYASWVDKMKECLENRVKMSGRKMKARGETESPNPKRHWCNLPKDHLLQRYLVRVQNDESEDPRSVKEHNKARHEEMKKPKPRDSLLLPLMKKTFQDRCIFIQNDASAVSDILEHYPALGRPVVIEQEISLLVGKKDIRTAFETSWTTSYVSALLKYAQRSKKKAMRDIFMTLEETDYTSRQITALAVLVASMTCIAEKDTDPLCYIIISTV